jgi:hypothetical protein
MKGLRHYILLFFLINGNFVQAQQDSGFVWTNTIHGDIVNFSVDNLGNIYLLNSEGQLKKLGPKGDSLAVYNDVRRYGNIYSMDVTNPLKILLYYREFSTIVEVDRFLNIINTIDLRSLNIFQAKAIGLAYDNSVWVYDEQEAKLKRVADDGSLVNETTDIRQFVNPVPDPTFITDQGGLVYLYDSAKGVYTFDYYGAFQKYVQLEGWQDFIVIEKKLLGRDLHNFLKYQWNNPAMPIERQPIPPSYLPAVKIIITPVIIYVLKQSDLEIYSRR